MKWLRAQSEQLPPSTRDEVDNVAIRGLHRTIARQKGGFAHKWAELLDSFVASEAERFAPQREASGRALVEIRYRNGERFVRCALPSAASRAEPPLRKGGTYLITGVAGAIGQVVARYLCDEWKADVILCGPSKKEAELPWPYLRADVTDLVEARALVAQVKSRYGALDGIIHLAGVIRDTSGDNAIEDELHAALGSEVQGALHLDEATKDEDLACFIVFSAPAAVHLGQFDYVHANSFMDHFAIVRHEQVQRSERFGKTLSIRWPAWGDGEIPFVREESGIHDKRAMRALDQDEALELIREVLQIDAPQIVVTQGSRAAKRR